MLFKKILNKVNKQLSYQIHKLTYITKFSFTEKKPARIIKVDLSEDGERKISIEDYSNNNPDGENKNSTILSSKKNYTTHAANPRIKIYGTENQDVKINEETSDNLLTRNNFFSDYCRLYIKAGDGGNGTYSVMKGPLFDQSIYRILIL